MPSPVRLKDIARTANVSTATVSFALRGSAQVSAETRSRIQRLAREMGWRPNPLVSAWMAHQRGSQRAHTGERIAYLNPFPSPKEWSFPWFLRFVEGARRRADAAGFALEEFWLNAATPNRMSRILEARGIRGVIIGSAPSTETRIELAWEKFAAVAQGFSVSYPPMSRVSNAYGHTMDLALQNLAALGYRRIGLVLWPEVDARNFGLWSARFRHYQAQIKAADRVPIFAGSSADSPRLAAWLKRERPQVVLSHESAIYRLLLDLGYRLPEDLGFACLDHHPEHPLFSGFAGVDHCIEEAGCAAVDLLVGQLNAAEYGIPASPRYLATLGKWVTGTTVQQVGSPAIGPISPTPLTASSVCVPPSLVLPYLQPNIPLG